jgi:gamma-glutamyl:cysteine ligase YbdK (ATP-grasp superfamily)
MHTGLEVEYWVVDRDGKLTAPGPLLDVDDRIDEEFVEPMLEVKTTPCSSTAELRDELVGRLRRIVDAAHEMEKRLVPLSTPLWAAPADIPYREKSGTQLQRQIIGPTFDDARFCAGTHIHVEQSASNVADQLNVLTALDPAFALVNSSSHYRGEHLLECARPYLYRRSCYGDAPEQGQLQPYVDSAAEWETRLESAYERFRRTALDRGVDEATFDAEFDPASATWTPVALRNSLSTVEWRSPDTALPSQVLRLADDVRTIVSRADERGTAVGPDASTDSDAVRLPSFDRVEQTVETAMHDGASHPSVRAYLRDRGFSPAAYDSLAPDRPDGWLSKKQARTLRLEAADRLEADLDRLANGPDPRFTDRARRPRTASD